jgi:hypothetical protein
VICYVERVFFSPLRIGTEKSDCGQGIEIPTWVDARCGLLTFPDTVADHFGPGVRVYVPNVLYRAVVINQSAIAGG